MSKYVKLMIALFVFNFIFVVFVVVGTHNLNPNDKIKELENKVQELENEIKNYDKEVNLMEDYAKSCGE